MSIQTYLAQESACPFEERQKAGVFGNCIGAAVTEGLFLKPRTESMGLLFLIKV